MAAPALALPANETDRPLFEALIESRWAAPCEFTLFCEVRAGEGEIWLVDDAGTSSNGLPDFCGGIVWLAAGY